MTVDVLLPPRPMIGADLPMPDAVERVVGTLNFTVDHSVEGMVHGKLVRSSFPHATILDVDGSLASQMEGVLGVITGSDIVEAEEVPNPFFGLARRDQPPLAVGKVRYVGDPVVLVVGDTPAHARAAAEAVVVDYEELPYVVDPMEASLPGAPVLHEEWPGNECGEWKLHRGDVEAAMAGAARIFEANYRSPLASPVPFEPHVAIARWAGGRLEIWTATQWPSAVQQELAHMFDLPPEGVRVMTFPLGGGYGAKSQLKLEPLVAAAARIMKRPVRIELERDEVFLTVAKHPADMQIRTGVDPSGRFVAREIDLLYNGGAYAVLTPKAVAQGLLRAAGPYNIPNIRIRSRGVYTNTIPSGSFRGAMTNQAAFAYESHSDEIAAGMGIDPVQLRMHNLLRDGEHFASGQVMHDTHFHELVENVASAIGWSGVPPPVEAGKARGKGIGVILKTSAPGSRSEAKIELRSDGQVRVYTSSVDMGQGVRGTLAQLAAHHLGVDFEDVTVLDPDTGVTFDSMTAGSRTTFVADRAIRQACDDLKAELAALAGAQLQVAPELLRHESGAVVGDSPGVSRRYTEVLTGAGMASLTAQGEYRSDPSSALSDPDDIKGEISVHWHQGAVAMEVEVDLETGRVEVVRSHGAAWAGRVVNPTRARQQSEGSIIFGIGPALYEELVIVDGQVSNPNLSDYMIPSILDVPIALTSVNLESDQPDAEIHGVGEMTIPAVAPAIANAVAQAAGVRVRDLPISPEKVLREIVNRAGERR